jgi:hypothetical protein
MKLLIYTSHIVLFDFLIASSLSVICGQPIFKLHAYKPCTRGHPLVMAEETLPLGGWDDDDMTHAFSEDFSGWNESALADATTALPDDWVVDVGLLGSPKARDSITYLPGSLQCFQ